jgi:predicted SprT family Zn-dependent metalloprotease
MDAIDRQVIRFQVMAKVKALLLRWKPLLVPELERVKVVEHSRPSGTAGRAKAKLEVQMNLLLCDTEEEYEKTFAHEMAHIVCYLAWPDDRIGHGAEWKQVMRRLGYPAERTHSIDLAARMPTRYTKFSCWRCGRENMLGPVQTRKLKRGQTLYRCRCGARILP